MALVVEDGTGLATAEAYASTADVGTYLTNRGSSVFSSKTATEQEEYVRLATDYIEAMFVFKGERTNPNTQALSWPREDVVTRDGRKIDSDAVPVELEKATAELAKRLADGTDIIPDLARGGAVKKSKVGPIETEFFENASSRTVFSIVQGIMRDLVISTNVISLQRG